MAQYAISGIWNSGSNITDYAVHRVSNVNGSTVYGSAKKYSKEDILILLDNPINSAKTIVWNYNSGVSRSGADIEVVGFGVNRYLRTVPDATVTDNLDNLINFGWLNCKF